MNTNLIYYTAFLLLCIKPVIFSQEITIAGRLLDRESGEAVSNAVVVLEPGNSMVTSDRNGQYSFVTFPGKKELSARAMGYRPATLELVVAGDTIVDIWLEVSFFEIGEVVVTGDSIKNVRVTSEGSYVMTPAALREMPRLFSEPDLVKAFHLLPGVVPGRDGSSDLYIRGGGTGQNIVLANGCYFFLPEHMLGFVSSLDIDFIESAELFKDYFPSELGGGASSVIKLNFKEPASDSLDARVRLGMLSSSATLAIPVGNWDMTSGLKVGNYPVYSAVLKKITDPEVGDYLPPDNYSFIDGFVKLRHANPNIGRIDYLFFGNFDRGSVKDVTESQRGNEQITYREGTSTGWNSMVHALEWVPPQKGSLQWKYNLNYNRLSMGRDVYSEMERPNATNEETAYSYTGYSFSPAINNIGTAITAGGRSDRFTYQGGFANRLRFFSPNVVAQSIVDDSKVISKPAMNEWVTEPALFFSAAMMPLEKVELNAGLRLSGAITREDFFHVIEPRIRVAYNPAGLISPHINYVRLSQFDHSLEGSGAGLRTMLWLPVSGQFGPEISDVVSAGLSGRIDDNIEWSLGSYYKWTGGMVDFIPGASFIHDSSLVDMIESIRLEAWGIETGLVKTRGKITGTLSYTYSRSEREWPAPEELIWIPSNADRPHNFNMALRYHLNNSMSFGINSVFLSGSPATIYTHSTSYAELFDTKNNIRFFDYHRLDLSFRYMVHKRRSTIFLDADVYNAYNRRNTYYFKETFDPEDNSYYFKNMSLFPIMPSVAVRVNF